MPGLIFGNDKHSRGCYREIMGPSTIGCGAILTMADGVYPTDPTEPYFITGVSFSQKEKYNIVQCFNGRNYTYAFGHDPQSSMIEVTFTMFLTNPEGDTFGESLETLTSAYFNSRLSKYPKYASLSVGFSATWEGFIVGMSSHTQDPEHNLQTFTVIMLVVEAQGGT